MESVNKYTMIRNSDVVVFAKKIRDGWAVGQNHNGPFYACSDDFFYQVYERARG